MRAVSHMGTLTLSPVVRMRSHPCPSSQHASSRVMASSWKFCCHACSQSFSANSRPSFFSTWWPPRGRTCPGIDVRAWACDSKQERWGGTKAGCGVSTECLVLEVAHRPFLRPPRQIRDLGADKHRRTHRSLTTTQGQAHPLAHTGRKTARLPTIRAKWVKSEIK